MTGPGRKVLVCTCEGSMPVHAEMVRQGNEGAEIVTARHACRDEIDRFRSCARAGRLTVGCTQERAVFEATAAEEGLAAELAFVNVRETAGWSDEASRAGPKMAALIATAAVQAAPPPTLTLESEGVTLVYGPPGPAIEAAERLKDILDITVLLTPGEAVETPRPADYPVRVGRIRSLTGHLGAFEITIDGYREPAASSRATLKLGPGRDGAISRADLLIDLSGGSPLVPAPDLRPGYLRADPGDPIAVRDVLLRAAALVGTFDAPRYVHLDAGLCTHSRSRKAGCRRCLDLCPAGAIAPDGDHVTIDAALCGGCGACAAACPTGAVTYTLPPAESLVRQVRTLLTVYRQCGGTTPVLLLHDGGHGAALIEAIARHVRGLPAHVLPLAVNEATAIGLETLLSAVAYGAQGVRVLMRARPRHSTEGLERTLAMAGAILDGLGHGAARIGLIQTDDPDALLEALAAPVAAVATDSPASFLPAGSPREILREAARALRRTAPTPVETIPLPELAPIGRVVLDTKACTLCLACVSACPTDALGDAPDRPRLTFDESRCVQCGVCRTTCPEGALRLEPRLHFPAFEAAPIVLHEDAPLACTRCGKPFGSSRSIARVTSRLAGHWMFEGANKSRLALLEMCDTCRIEAVTNAGLDPFAGPARPPARTSDDYILDSAPDTPERSGRTPRDGT